MLVRFFIKVDHGAMKIRHLTHAVSKFPDHNFSFSDWNIVAKNCLWKVRHKCMIFTINFFSKAWHCIKIYTQMVSFIVFLWKGVGFTWWEACYFHLLIVAIFCFSWKYSFCFLIQPLLYIKKSLTGIFF